MGHVRRDVGARIIVQNTPVHLVSCVALLTFKIILLPFQNLSGASSLNP